MALAIEDWETIGYDVPLLVDMQPAGKYLGEEYYRAGGLPAVMHELLQAGRIHADALTVNGKTMGENVKDAEAQDRRGDPPLSAPLGNAAGFKVLSGNLFDSAIMKTSVISEEFRQRYLSDPEATRTRSRAALWCSTGPRTTTRASMILRSGSTSAPCCSSAAWDRSAIRARRRW